MNNLHRRTKNMIWNRYFRLICTWFRFFLDRCCNGRGLFPQTAEWGDVLSAWLNFYHNLTIEASASWHHGGSLYFKVPHDTIPSPLSCTSWHGVLNRDPNYARERVPLVRLMTKVPARPSGVMCSGSAGQFLP